LLPVFLTAPAPTELYTLSLHDALPICKPAYSHRFLAGAPSGLLNTDVGHLGRTHAVARLDGHRVDLAGKAQDVHALAHADLFFADRKSTRLNSSHVKISYAVFCLKKKI